MQNIGYMHRITAPITVIQLWHVISDRGMSVALKWQRSVSPIISDEPSVTLPSASLSSLGVGLRSEWRTREEARWPCLGYRNLANESFTRKGGHNVTPRKFCAHGKFHGWQAASRDWGKYMRVNGAVWNSLWTNMIYDRFRPFSFNRFRKIKENI